MSKMWRIRRYRSLEVSAQEGCCMRTSLIRAILWHAGTACIKVIPACIDTSVPEFAMPQENECVGQRVWPTSALALNKLVEQRDWNFVDVARGSHDCAAAHRSCSALAASKDLLSCWHFACSTAFCSKALSRSSRMRFRCILSQLLSGILLTTKHTMSLLPCLHLHQICESAAKANKRCEKSNMLLWHCADRKP